MDGCENEKYEDSNNEILEIIIDKILYHQRILLESYINFFTDSYKAIFRARIQKGGRIAIPETEREALNLKDGELVRVILMKEDM